MEEQDYEYRGLMAESWDLLRGDTSRWADRFFFLDLIGKSGQPVLDVGCGTGRHLLDYMQQGIDIDGVDNSPEMLAILREKALALGLQPRVYVQAMEKLDLPRSYRTIIVPSSSLQLVLDPRDVQDAMRGFFRHLEPGGTLAAPLMTLWEESRGEGLVQEWHKSGEAVRPDGLSVRRWSWSRYDPQTSMEHTHDRYELLRDGQVVHTEELVRSPATRSYTQEEGLALFRDAGFQDVSIYKGFSWEPAGAEDTALFTIMGKRPEER